MSNLTVEGMLMYGSLTIVGIGIGIFLYREVKKRLEDNDISREEYELNTKYKELLDKLEEVASQHPSRRKQVLVRRMRQLVESGVKTPEETVSELVHTAYEVPSRTKTIFGRTLLRGAEMIRNGSK